MVSIIVGLGGAFALWQAWLRWRAYGTADVRELVAEARINFYDITAHGELDTSEFLTGDRQTLEQRLRDVRGQLHEHVLQDRVDHLSDCLRSAWASAPPNWFGIAQGDVSVTTDSPEPRIQVARQVEAAHNGLMEVESVLDRCNQLDGPIVRP